MTKEVANARFSPAFVIVVHSNKDGSNYYLERSEVKSLNGKPVLAAPVPLTEDVLQSLASAYVSNNGGDIEFEGVIPEHVLYAENKVGRSLVVWYRPAMQRVLNMSQALGIKAKIDGPLPVPATLYLATGRNLYVFALMDDQRPNEHTKLYGAPFFNIYEDGRVCLGTAKVGAHARTFEGEAERFERAFYMAEQNGGITNHCKTQLPALWTRIAKKPQAFPSKDELIQHKKFKTLDDLLRQLDTNKII